MRWSTSRPRKMSPRGAVRRASGTRSPQLPNADSRNSRSSSDEFFNRTRPAGRWAERGGNSGPRRVNSLGSGFIIDTAGIAVTNNHVIADADEVNIILNDGTKIPAEIIGKRSRRPIMALLKFKPPEKPLKAVQVRRFRFAAAGRVGGRDRQPVQPRRHGDRRHRLGAQPRHQLRSLRQLHSDRCCHQPGQFRRAAVQSRTATWSA